MKRKVVKQGEATLMVSLPSKWAKKYNLSKGQEVDIKEVDNNLVISKEGIDIKKKVTLEIKDNSESLIRISIINAYRAGFDVIHINFKSNEEYKIILDVLRDYIIGFDVIKKELNSCTLENITEPSEDQFEVLFRKIFFNISSLINATELRLKNKNSEYKDLVLKTHQYDDFCRRIISKKNYTASKSGFYWSFLSLLGHGQRELYHLNKFLDNNKVNFNDMEILNDLRKIFELLTDVYVKKDINKLEEIHKLEKILIFNKVYKKIQKSQKENIVLYHLAGAARNFYLSTSPLTGLIFDNKL